MKTLLATGLWTVPLFAATAALGQTGQMMNDSMWGSGWMGGYGGVWVPILLVAVVVAAVVVIMQRRSK